MTARNGDRDGPESLGFGLYPISSTNFKPLKFDESFGEEITDDLAVAAAEGLQLVRPIDTTEEVPDGIELDEIEALESVA